MFLLYFSVHFRGLELMHCVNMLWMIASKENTPTFLMDSKQIFANFMANFFSNINNNTNHEKKKFSSEKYG